MACPCGDPRCHHFEQVQADESKARECERQLDEAYERRRWSRLAWMRHLDRLGRKAA